MKTMNNKKAKNLETLAAEAIARRNGNPDAKTVKNTLYGVQLSEDYGAEVYENGAGALFLAILQDGEPVRIFEGFERMPAGALRRVCEELAADVYAFEEYGDLVERLTGEVLQVTAASLYADGLGELVAEVKGRRPVYYSINYGAAAERAFADWKEVQK